MGARKPNNSATAARPRAHGRHAGFTLAELLAVAVCLALLAAVAAPSLATARMEGRTANCARNLARITEASRIYAAADPQTWFIPFNVAWTLDDLDWARGAYEWGGKSGIGRPGFADRPGELGSRYGTAAYAGPSTRPLNRVLYGRDFADHQRPYDRLGALADTKLALDVYRCPSDDGAPLAAHCPDWVANSERSSFDHFGTSYAANLFWITADFGGSVFSNSPHMRPVSRVPNPARTYAYEENIGRWAWAARRENPQCNFVGIGVDPGRSKAIGSWHGQDWVYNRAFMDGSVRDPAIFEQGTEDSEGYAQHYRIETVYPDNPDLQAVRRCIIVRGDGWQKDTLPADVVPTGRRTPGGGGRASYEDCVDPAPFLSGGSAATQPNKIAR